MKKYIKVSALSLSIIAGLSMESYGEDNYDIISASGSITKIRSTDQDQKDLPPLVEVGPIIRTVI